MAPVDTDHAIAEYFDARVGLFEAFTPDELARVRECLRAWDIQPGLRVLEPGCGSGRLTALLADAIGETGEVWALDVSVEMIRRAQARGLPSTVRFVQANASDVPAPSGHFDRVVCCCVFPHFLSPARPLAEFFRVLRSEGLLVIQHLESRDAMNAFHRDHAPGAPSRPLPADPEMRRLVADAGFDRIDIEDDPRGYRVRGRKP
jgi:demethylmenaquinone methyltransferase/2-methoxy-6-polyprenyl-1,4-benzoquinol methylase